MNEPKVTIYTKSFCPYCSNAKHFFKERNIIFDEITLEKNPEMIDEIKNKTGWRTFPIIMINEKLIGGYSDLKELDQSGKLKELL